MSPALAGSVSREWQVNRLLEVIEQISHSSDVRYEVEKLRHYREGLLSLAPFKPGDRAYLVDPPKIEKGSGWYSSRHFLIAGAPCEIREVDWHVPLNAESGAEGHFTVAAMFDNESYMSDYDYGKDGRIFKLSKPREVFREPEKRHVYYMSAKRFRSCSAPSQYERNER